MIHRFALSPTKERNTGSPAALLSQGECRADGPLASYSQPSSQKVNGTKREERKGGTPGPLSGASVMGTECPQNCLLVQSTNVPMITLHVP